MEMERPGKFQRLAAHPDIDAACVASISEGEVKVEATRGVEHWGRIFPLVFAIMSETKEEYIRIIVGTHTVIAESRGDQAIAVVFTTGCSVAKSVRRMIRQVFGEKRKAPRIVEPSTDRSTPSLAPLTPPAQPDTNQPPQPSGTSANWRRPTLVRSDNEN